MKLASYLWHLCCCFHFHWVIAGILGLATLSPSLNAAQELLPGIQRRSEGTVLLQVSGQIVCSFVFFHAFKFFFRHIYLLCIRHLHAGSVCKAHTGLLRTGCPGKYTGPVFFFSGAFTICASNSGLKAASQKMHCKGVKSQNPVISTASMVWILFLESPLKGPSGRKREEHRVYCCVPKSFSQS